MPVFVPPLAWTSPRSTGEAKVLRWLARLDDDWHILHSVGILRHATKAWSEADVVVVGPPGVLVLEVKGGRVERRRGLWTFTDRSGRVNTRPEGPFDQAGGASAALRRMLIEAGALDADQAIGYGVAFPDAELKRAAPADVLEQVMLDADDDWSQPCRTLTSWLSYWSARQGLRRGCDERSRRSIVAALRGDLELQEPLAGRVDALHVLQRAETERQLDVCRAGRANPRVVFRCAPASGGHLLAVQTFLDRRSAGLGAELVVSDADVANWVRRILGADADGYDSEQVAVTNQASVVLSLAETAPGQRSTVRAEHVRESVALASSSSWFQFVIDHVKPDEDPPSEGTVAISIQPCRTTKEIALFGSLLVRQVVDVRRLPSGPAVRTKWFDDSQGAVDLVKEGVAELAEDLDPDQLLILLGRQSIELRDQVRAVLPAGYESVPTLPLTSRSLPEADAVIAVLTDVDLLEPGVLPGLLRARAVLNPVLHAGLRGALDEGGAWYGDRIRRELGEPPLLSAF